jgi:acyl-coenzyme A synthetase/AMP-(fatty) acid ligase
VLAGDGQLRLEGRIDDCIRTRDNRLVSLGVVSEAIRAMSGVRASIVLPLDSRAGASFGAVVQCAPDTTIQELREKLSAALPEWGLPRRIVLVQEWPTLANGKTDRLACQTLLAKSGT